MDQQDNRGIRGYLGNLDQRVNLEQLDRLELPVRQNRGRVGLLVHLDFPVNLVVLGFLVIEDLWDYLDHQGLLDPKDFQL